MKDAQDIQRKPESHPSLIALWIAFLLFLSLSGCASGPELKAFARIRETEQTAYGGIERRKPTEQDLPILTDDSALSDYLAYAAINNPGLRAAFERWKAALEKIPQVRTLPDPRFNYGWYIEEVETRVGPQRNRFGLFQTLPWLGKLKLRGDVALEAAEAERERYEGEKLKLFYRVKDAYYEYYYLGRAIAIVRENRDLVKYIEGVARSRYKVAAAEHADVIRAQVELGKLEDRLRTLEELREPVVAQLNAALNRPVQDLLPWPTEIPEEKIEATDEDLLAWLREASPEIKALDHDIAREKRAIALAKKDYFPDLTIGADYIETGSARSSGVSNSGKDALIATFSVNVPVWFEKYRAGVEEAEARHWAASKSKIERENTLSSDVKMVLYNFRDAGRKIDLFRDTLLPKARESLKATEAAYRAGNASFSDLVDAERTLLEFEISHERALSNHAQRLAEIEMLIGKEIPRAGTPSKQE